MLGIQRYYETDLSALENAHSIMEHFASKPQYLRDQQDVETSREKYES